MLLEFMHFAAGSSNDEVAASGCGDQIDDVLDGRHNHVSNKNAVAVGGAALAPRLLQKAPN
jgi:hypothetical protein